MASSCLKFPFSNIFFFCRLKSGIEFHLFITTSPCGDARIFSLHESPSANTLPSTAPSTTAEGTGTPTTAAGIGSLPSSLPQSAVGSTASLLIKSQSAADLCKSEESLVEAPEQNSVEVSPQTAENNNEIENKIITSLVVKIRSLNLEDDDGQSEKGSVATDSTKEALEPEPEKEKRLPDSSRGMLRSKIECGMGTVPINPKVLIQTWDGVMSGDRLLTMACSDKILRWNVLGSLKFNCSFFSM